MVPYLSFREKWKLTFTMNRRERGFWFGMAVELLWPVAMIFCKWRMGGREHVPDKGGFVLATNHLSFADPVSCTAFCLVEGRMTRYLAKASLWNVPVLKWAMKGGRHIPVYRGSSKAGDAYRSALDSARAGECLVFYPEGTFSKREDRWPSLGKTGAARVALSTGVPVIPMANWGTDAFLPRRSYPRLLPRKTITLIAGPPVDLADLMPAPGEAPGRAVLEEATERIMRAIVELLAQARGEEPPKDVLAA